MGSVDPWIANANTPPRSPNIGIEEIDHSPLHNRLPPLCLRSMLMRVRQQMAKLSMIDRLSEHVGAIVGIGDLDETNH